MEQHDGLADAVAMLAKDRKRLLFAGAGDVGVTGQQPGDRQGRQRGRDVDRIAEFATQCQTPMALP
jgi:hypothetical protein